MPEKPGVPDLMAALKASLAEARAARSPVEDACAETWCDEIGCEGGWTWHHCTKDGIHRTHVCRRCDSMVIDDA